MLLRNLLRPSASGKPIYGTPDIGFNASQIIAETATGDHGPGLLYAAALANTGKQLRVKITSWSGTPGTLFVFENGSLLIDEGQADGAYVIGFDWEAWAADGSLTVVSDTSPVQIGPLSATAPAANVIGTSTISAPDATGEVNATAPAANVTGPSTIDAGDATGGGSGDATAPAANVTGTSTIDVGQAVGEQNATAPTANVTGTSSIDAVDATGDRDGTAPAANVIGTSTISAGNATDGSSVIGAPKILVVPARRYLLRVKL